MVRHILTWFSLFLVLNLLTGCNRQVVVNSANTAPPPPDAGIPEATPTSTELDVSPEIDIPLRDAGIKENTETISESPITTTVPTPARVLPEYSSDDKELARRIVRWKRRIDRNIWRECGEKYTAEDIPGVALLWANAINDAYKNTTYNMRSGEVRKVDKKEAVGVILHESRFDRCAVGPNPRKFAYKHKLLKRPGNSVSHSLEELEIVFKHPKFQGKLADIGPGQIVKKIGAKHHTWNETKEFLTVYPGVQKVFTELARRGTMYNTRTPSAHWPGSKRHLTYTIKIMRYASYIFSNQYYKKIQ